MDKGVLSAGQSMGFIYDIPTCQELVQNIVGDAERIINERLAAMVGGTVPGQSTAA